MTTKAEGGALEDGYPTEEALARVRAWPWNDCTGLMAFVHSLWNWPDWGWRETVRLDGTDYAVSTGGWSGNEDLIDALQENTMFWMLCWRSSRRGGHFEFEVKLIAEQPRAAPPSSAVALSGRGDK